MWLFITDYWRLDIFPLLSVDIPRGVFVTVWCQPDPGGWLLQSGASRLCYSPVTVKPPFRHILTCRPCDRSSFRHHSVTIPPPFRHHSATIPSPFRHHSVTIPSPFRYHSATIPSPFGHHSVTIPPPFRHHSVTIRPPFRHHSVTIPSPFRHHSVTC